MKKRYDASVSAEPWDAIFVGSGPGCLTAGAVLAKAGQRVLLLERHYEPGGFTHTFKRRGWEWDVGVHYIGNVHRERSVDRRLFDYITEGRLKWADMGSPYDKAILDGQAYDFIPNWEEQIELWQSYFPEDAEAIATYGRMVRECAGSSKSFFSERAVPSLVSSVAGRFMTKRFHTFSDRTTYDVLRELTANETLITVLCTQCGDYGLSPNRSSFAMHAMLVNHYRNGGAYPIGGAPSIHKGIIDTIEANGGEVVLRASVSDILMEGGKAIGVRLEGGEEIRGKAVISGIGARNTYLRLLPEEYAPAGLKQGLKAVPPSMAHQCLYLGLNKSDVELGLPKYNYWCYDPYTQDPNAEAGKPGGRVSSAYISFPSAKDPSWLDTHPGLATVQCIGFGVFNDFAKWADTRWRKRGDGYEEAKDAFKEQMLGILHTLHPNVREHIGWAEVSTPLSTAHFSNYPQGEIYGLEHTPERFRVKWLRPKTPVKNFYLTGQDIVTCGIAGALMSGIVTSSYMLSKNVMMDIMKAS